MPWKRVTWRSVRPWRERDLARARERPERRGLRRPIEISHRPGEAIEMMFGAVVILDNAFEVRQILQSESAYLMPSP